MLSRLGPGPLFQRRRQRRAHRGSHHQEDRQHQQVLRLVHPKRVQGRGEEIVEEHERESGSEQGRPQMAHHLGSHHRQEIEEGRDRGSSMGDERGEAGHEQWPCQRDEGTLQAERLL